MKLFGWKAGRDPSRPALSRGPVRVGSAGGAPAGAGEVPRSYEAQVREAFLLNPVAQRAVRLVAEGVASAPLAASHPELLALLGAPDADGAGGTAGGGVGEGAGGPPLLETVAAQLLLHGNAYLQLLPRADGMPAALYPLRPERVVAELDAAGWPAAYRYQVGTAVQRLSPDAPRPEVIHLRGLHPLDDHAGAGCLPAAALAVQVHNAAGQWSRALLGNAARPSGALVYEPGDGSAMSADQFARLREEMEAAFAGAANAGRPMLLEGGLRWQPLSLSPADLDFAQTRAAAARDIALAFGVPPMLLGLPGDATYSNYKEANRALWRLTLLPLTGLILRGLAGGLAGFFPGARLRVELDRVPALAQDRATLWQSVGGADFLSGAEKRALLGLPERPAPAAGAGADADGEAEA